jgi:hypothetical protein
MEATPPTEMDYFIGLLKEINEETLLEHCCKFITFSAVRPTTEQRELLMAKLEQDERYELLRRPPSPLLGTPTATEAESPREVKPDTLMPNSCGICGASFLDHGSAACTEDLCLYERRNAPTAIVDSQATVADTQENCLQCDICGVWEPQDNWVQCDTCSTWHKIKSTEGLPEKWYCSAIGKACRAPKAAERFWPSSRAKRFAKHYYPSHMRPSHMKCLQLLAARKSLTVEQLCATDPINYVGAEHKYLYERLTGVRNRWGPYYYY